MTSEGNDDRLDAGLKAAFPASPKSIVVKIGAQPISLRDESSGLAPLVRPRSLDVPSGREGRYQILGEIARGGMGVVVRGHDVDLGRDVAIKVLREDHATKPDVVQRFVEEAQIGGQLQHPGIVPVYELGQRSDQRPFFTMKLVKGKTLAALLADRPDPTHDRRRFLSIFEAVCHTMAYAHARGVIHRDLKPANVMLGAFGEVQIVDWGMGKVLGHGGVADERLAKSRAQLSIIATVRSERDGSDSLAGSVMGTPAYMSPEQARGAVNELDERCDVFSLGAILCEILTGQPPYVGEALTKAVNADLADATARLEGCGAEDDLVRLAKSCLVPAAIARPKDASVLAAAIGAHLASVEERAQKSQLDAAESKVKATEERRRRKLSLALAASVVALVVLGGAGWVAIESARRERIAEATHAVSRALDEAALLAGKAEAGDDLVAWREAVAAAKRAESLAESKDADPATRARAHEIATRLEAGERAATAKAEQRAKDQAMVARLDEIRASRGDDWDSVVADQKYAEAFRSYGIDVEGTAIEDASRHVRESSVCTDLIVALDDWIDMRGADDGNWQRLRVLVQACDDDPWRKSFRSTNDVEDLRHLADRADLDTIPVATLVGLANQLGLVGDASRAASLAKAVARRHPSDFWAEFTAGRWASTAHPPQLTDAVVFDTAAVAVRPHSAFAHNNLGVALDAANHLDDAIREWREVVRLRPNTATPHAVVASALLKKGDIDGAVAECRTAIAIDRNDARFHVLLGSALESRNEPYGALAEYRVAIQFAPTSLTAREHLAKALTAQGDPDGPVDAARECVGAFPNNSEAHVNLGIELKNKHDVDGAIDEYHTAIRLDAKRASAHHFLAHALEDKPDARGAIAEFRESLRLDPNSAEVHIDLGLALEATDVDAALSEFREAVRLQPGWPHAHLRVGNALLKKRDFDGAVVEYRKAIQLKPDDTFALYDLGVALKSAGEFEQAIAAYDEALRLQPDDIDTRLALGLALMASGDVDRAIVEYRGVIRRKPDYAFAHYDLGLALDAKGDLEGVIDEYREAARLAPDDGDIHNALAWTLATTPREDLRNPDEAIRVARRAIEIQPTDGLSVNTLGVALYRRGDFAEALSTLAHSIDLRKGGDSADWLFLAMAHARLGHAEEAQRWYRRAVEDLAKQSSVRDELTRFRAEAEQVLGVSNAKR